MAEIKKKYDVIIVGAGVAGLNCALHIPKDKSVLIICKEKHEASDSYLAQGGICRLIGEEDYVDYFEDTMRAGHYENDPVAVECMIRSSQGVIDELIAAGVDFERNESGGLAYTREGGHSTPRICYHADSTGREITSKLMNAVMEMSNVQIEEFVTMLDIIEDGKQCYGIVVQDGANGQIKNILADYTVLATGGLGGAFSNSTNYRVVTGDSLAICLNHGISVDNINYIQVHPTTL
ncbi:MAG: FAD-dependent oxidoreductase, partial [Clostridia bacterium]|nr:FAD-dependent oxidoreductase [Clostridia bacterium]